MKLLKDYDGTLFKSRKNNYQCRTDFDAILSHKKHEIVLSTTEDVNALQSRIDNQYNKTKSDKNEK